MRASAFTYSTASRPDTSAIPAPPTGTTTPRSARSPLPQSADDVLAHAQKFALTHIVYRDPPYEFENAAMREFRERYTVPVRRANGLVVAAIRPAPKP